MIHASFLCRLGRDPESRTTNNGDKVLNLNVATDRGWGENKTTMWIRCAIFGKRAESLSRHLTKGSQVLITGELYTREWENKEGAMVTSLECRVSELEFAGSKGDNQNSHQPAQNSHQGSHQAPAGYPQPSAEFDDSDLPF